MEKDLEGCGKNAGRLFSERKGWGIQKKDGRYDVRLS
jgi:hypothetical protein